MKFQALEAICAKDAFQIQPLFLVLTIQITYQYTK